MTLCGAWPADLLERFGLNAAGQMRISLREQRLWSTVLSALVRFLGDSPLRVFLKLVVISFLVGIVMSAFGWSPLDVLQGIRDFFVDIWNMGFAALDRFLGYFLLGAAVVVPAFILLRLFSYRKGG